VRWNTGLVSESREAFGLGRFLSWVRALRWRWRWVVRGVRPRKSGMIVVSEKKEEEIKPQTQVQNRS